ncbi:uncharacterized protein [Rhodnius prolixus]|uniref:uncharacterized protein n=1 Tax=Rhodnius prolixus TaxID=13249 RepID=UPI003D18F2EC
MYTLSFLILSLFLVIATHAQNIEIRPIRPGESVLGQTSPKTDLKAADSTIYYAVPVAYNRVYPPYYSSYYYPYYKRPVIGYGYKPYVGLKAYLPYGLPLYG